jgi:hypothetical protein
MRNNCDKMKHLYGLVYTKEQLMLEISRVLQYNYILFSSLHNRYGQLVPDSRT